MYHSWSLKWALLFPILYSFCIKMNIFKFNIVDIVTIVGSIVSIVEHSWHSRHSVLPQPIILQTTAIIWIFVYWEEEEFKFEFKRNWIALLISFLSVTRIERHFVSWWGGDAPSTASRNRCNEKRCWNRWQPQLRLFFSRGVWRFCILKKLKIGAFLKVFWSNWKDVHFKKLT